MITKKYGGKKKNEVKIELIIKQRENNKKIGTTQNEIGIISTSIPYLEEVEGS